MDKIELRNELVEQLWRMYKMDIMVYLREFLAGEMAALECLGHHVEPTTPTMLSEELKLSRPRMANILSSLRRKGYISMDIDHEDRRRMNVDLTEEGRNYLQSKFEFLAKYLDKYVEVLGETKIVELTQILKDTADSENTLIEKFGGEKSLEAQAGESVDFGEGV